MKKKTFEAEGRLLGGGKTKANGNSTDAAAAPTEQAKRALKPF
jgi:hypothetical protein